MSSIHADAALPNRSSRPVNNSLSCMRVARSRVHSITASPVTARLYPALPSDHRLPLTLYYQSLAVGVSSCRIVLIAVHFTQQPSVADVADVAEAPSFYLSSAFAHILSITCCCQSFIVSHSRPQSQVASYSFTALPKPSACYRTPVRPVSC